MFSSSMGFSLFFIQKLDHFPPVFTQQLHPIIEYEILVSHCNIEILKMYFS